MSSWRDQARIDTHRRRLRAAGEVGVIVLDEESSEATAYTWRDAAAMDEYDGEDDPAAENVVLTCEDYDAMSDIAERIGKGGVPSNFVLRDEGVYTWRDAEHMEEWETPDEANQSEIERNLTQHGRVVLTGDGTNSFGWRDAANMDEFVEETSLQKKSAAAVAAAVANSDATNMHAIARRLAAINVDAVDGPIVLEPTRTSEFSWRDAAQMDEFEELAIVSEREEMKNKAQQSQPVVDSDTSDADDALIAEIERRVLATDIGSTSLPIELVDEEAFVPEDATRMNRFFEEIGGTGSPKGWTEFTEERDFVDMDEVDVAIETALSDAERMGEFEASLPPRQLRQRSYLAEREYDHMDEIEVAIEVEEVDAAAMDEYDGEDDDAAENAVLTREDDAAMDEIVRRIGKGGGMPSNFVLRDEGVYTWRDAEHMEEWETPDEANQSEIERKLTQHGRVVLTGDGTNAFGWRDAANMDEFEEGVVAGVPQQWSEFAEERDYVDMDEVDVAVETALSDDEKMDEFTMPSRPRRQQSYAAEGEYDDMDEVDVAAEVALSDDERMNEFAMPSRARRQQSYEVEGEYDDMDEVDVAIEVEEDQIDTARMNAYTHRGGQQARGGGGGGGRPMSPIDADGCAALFDDVIAEHDEAGVHEVIKSREVRSPHRWKTEISTRSWNESNDVLQQRRSDIRSIGSEIEAFYAWITTPTKIN